MGYLPKHIKQARHREAMMLIAMAALRGATFEYRLDRTDWLQRRGHRRHCKEWRAEFGGFTYVSRFYVRKSYAAHVFLAAADQEGWYR